MSQLQDKPVTALSIFICLLGSTFYIYDFFVRIAPSVMTADLMRDLHTFAPGLGAMSSALFLTYTIMQIPAGLLIDHYGVRRQLALSALCCGLATFGFAYAHSVWFAAFMFAIIGVTAGFAFIAALVLAARWFHAKYFALIVGLVQFMGCVGGIFAQAPLHHATVAFGWRHTMMGTASLGLLLAILYFFFLQEAPASDLADINRRAKAHSIFADLGLLARRMKQVFKNSQNWWLAGFILCLWTPVSLFTSLWGVLALKALFHLPSGQAAVLASAVWVGVALMGPTWGWWSDRIGKRKLPAILACLSGLISTGVLLALPSFTRYGLMPNATPLVIIVLLLFFGVASGGLSMSYALIRDNNNDEVVGTAVGFNNMACVLGTPLFQPVVSWILQSCWQGKIVNQVPVYTGHNFQIALSAMPILYACALLICLFALKETHCEKAY